MATATAAKAQPRLKQRYRAEITKALTEDIYHPFCFTWTTGQGMFCGMGIRSRLLWTGKKPLMVILPSMSPMRAWICSLKGLTAMNFCVSTKQKPASHLPISVYGSWLPQSER